MVGPNPDTLAAGLQTLEQANHIHTLCFPVSENISSCFLFRVLEDPSTSVRKGHWGPCVGFRKFDNFCFVLTFNDCDSQNAN